MFNRTLLAAACARVFANAASAVTIEELKDKLVDLSEAANGIQARADAEKRQLSDDERKEVDNIMSTFEDTEAEIEKKRRT